MYGTHAVSDSLAAFLEASDYTIQQFGEQKAFEAIAQQLVAHNELVKNQIVPDLVEMTTSNLDIYGGSDDVEWQDMDEFGTPDAQKVTAGQAIGYPLRKGAAAVQWTRVAFENMTAGEMQASATAIMTRDLRNLSKQIRRAVFLSTNYTFTDYLVTKQPLPVKRLLNADGVAIPPDPYGNAFDGATHTHYLARAGGSFVVADLQALVDTLVEHNAAGVFRVYINKAQEAAVRAFTGFVPTVDARIVQPDTATYVPGGLNLTETQNRRIGVFGAAEIWVKAWIPANYLFGFDATRKPLRMRERRSGSGDLKLVYENEQFPLRCRAWEREFGVGVRERDAAAVLYVGDTTYADPTIN